MDKSKIAELIQNHRMFFASGRTRELSFRLEQLRLLRRAILLHETAIFDALKQDLNKPYFEAYGGDTAIVINEIDYKLRHLGKWIKPKKTPTPRANSRG